MRQFREISFAALTVGMLLMQSASAQTTQVDKLYSGDPSPLDQFGSVVALSGDIAVVGARSDDLAGPDDSGSASIFVRNGDVWSREATLVSATPTANGAFGTAVAVDDNTVMIGSGNARAVYVFERVSGVWSLRQTLTGTDLFVPIFQFGASIAIDGDTAIIGAYLGPNQSGTRTGAAYVFTRDVSGTWSQKAKLVADDGENSDWFGYSIALDGDSAIIGALLDDSRKGAAYVFVRSAPGVWSQQAKLIANDGIADDDFSNSVSIEGDTAAVASFRQQASVYVFRRTGTSWSQQPKLVAEDPGLTGGAYSVEISGDLVLFGAANDSRVFVFGRDGGNWSQLERLLPGDPAFTFGQSISFDGTTALIGAPLDDDFGQFSGSAFVFSLDFAQEVDSDGDGILDDADLCPDTNPGEAVDVFGCSYEQSIDVVINGIQNLVNDPGTSDKARKDLIKAQAKLDKALEKLAKGDVKKAIKEQSKAVKELLKAGKDGSDVVDLIESLVESAKNQAQDAIDAAIVRGGKQNEIDKALDEMDKAQEKLVERKPDKAIDRYAKAWDRAEKA